MVERDFLEDVWPLRILSKVMPRLKHIFREARTNWSWNAWNTREEIFARANAERGPVIETALSFSEMKRIMAEGKIAVMRSVEGAHHLNGNLDNVEVFFERGVCHMIVPHLYPNEACENVDCFQSMAALRRSDVSRKIQPGYRVDALRL